MADSSQFNACHSLEWNTELPYIGIDRMSPIFRVRGIEHRFRFSRDASYFRVALMLIDEASRSRFRSFGVTVHVELKQGSSTHLIYGPLTVACSFTSNCLLIEQSVVKSKTGNNISYCNTTRFLFTFDSADEVELPGLQDSRGEKSTQADLTVIQPDLEPLSTDLGSLLDNEVSPDVRFHCKDGVTHAHRLILAARSKVFSTMFQTDMAEKETGEVNVRHIDLQTMRLFLKFMYSGKIPDFPGEMIPDLYVLGDKYDVPSLKGMCSDFMAKNVSEDNYIDYLILADAHGDDIFKRSLVYFVINNPGLMRNEQWLKFSAEHMKLALEVLQAHVDKLTII